jgi:hypothetical protein
MVRLGPVPVGDRHEAAEWYSSAAQRLVDLLTFDEPQVSVEARLVNRLPKQFPV